MEQSDFLIASPGSGVEVARASSDPIIISETFFPEETPLHRSLRVVLEKKFDILLALFFLLQTPAFSASPTLPEPKNPLKNKNMCGTKVSINGLLM